MFGEIGEIKEELLNFDFWYLDMLICMGGFFCFEEKRKKGGNEEKGRWVEGSERREGKGSCY